MNIQDTSSPFGDATITFDALPLSGDVRRAIDEMGFKSPTPVQLAVFESASQGRDLVVQARTGTGKTAAFGLPLVDRLVDPARREVQSLILAPTRELALQISRQLTELGRHRGLEVVAIYGGASMQPQVDALRSGAQIVVGTPGRVLDHLERGTLSVTGLRVAILDESDEMLSMGFLPQITAIFERLPDGKQTLLFSATVPPGVRRIAEGRLRNPEFITLSGDHVGALSIEHYVYTSRGDKAQELVRLIEIENPESAIVFCNTREQTKRIAGALQAQGFRAEWLNADLAQNDRERVMQATREGKLRFLVATDVAARGIDISHLTHVINADFPESTENYVHRTGRTGRAGRTGKAVSLITPQDVGNLYMLRLTYKIFPVERELPSPEELRARREADLILSLREEARRHRPAEPALSLARRLLASEDAESLVATLLAAHFEREPEFEANARQARLDRQPRPVEVPAERERDESSKKDKEKKKKKKDKEKKRKHDEDEDEDPRASETTERREVNSETPREASNARSSSVAEPAPREAPPALPSETSLAPNGEKLESISAAEALSRLDDEDLGRVFLDLGKRDGLYREDVLEVLEDGGFDPSEVHFVKIRDTHTFVGVPTALLEKAVALLDGATVGGLAARAEKARPKAR